MKQGLIVLVIILLFPAGARAQAVVDATFCLGIEGKACSRSVPSGAAVKLDALRKVKGKPAIYFWGSLRSSAVKSIAFMFQREGTCTREQVTLPVEKFNEQPSVFARVKGFFEGRTLANVWKLLGIDDPSVGYKDIKVNVALVEPSDGYRVYTWRNIECAGVMRARFFDSDGSPLPGNNAVKEVRITRSVAALEPPR